MYMPLHFEEPPELGQRAMNWAGCMFQIVGVSLFGDEVYCKPLPSFCTDGKWHYHLGTDLRWIELKSLIPCVKPNTACTGRKASRRSVKSKSVKALRQ